MVTSIYAYHGLFGWLILARLCIGPLNGWITFWPVLETTDAPRVFSLHHAARPARNISQLVEVARPRARRPETIG
jgi:hypothetical protein